MCSIRWWVETMYGKWEKNAQIEFILWTACVWITCTPPSFSKLFNETVTQEIQLNLNIITLMYDFHLGDNDKLESQGNSERNNNNTYIT